MLKWFLLPVVFTLGILCLNSRVTKDGYSQDSQEVTTKPGEVSLVNFELRDIVPPSLEVSNPKDSMVTNKGDLVVEGQVESGSSVTVNGVSASTLDSTTEDFSHKLTLEEGSNTVAVIAKDETGNTTEVSVKITLDTISPSLDVLTPAEGAVTKSPLLEVNGTVEVGATLTINGNEVNSNPSTGEFGSNIDLAAGQNTITIIANDTAGNITKVVRTVTLDTSKPSLLISSPVDGLATNDPTLIVVGKVEVDSSVTVNGANVIPDTTTGDFSYDLTLEEGFNTITVTARNKANAETTITKTVILDTIPSLLIVTTPTDGSATNISTLSVSGTAEVGVNLTVNGTVVIPDSSTGDFSFDIILTEGQNTITVEATDLAGNITTEVRIVTLNTGGPNLTISSPVDGLATNNSLLTVMGNVELGSTVIVNGENVVPDTTTGDFSHDLNLIEGESAITVNAEDSLGTKATIIRNVTLDTTPPTTPNVSGTTPTNDTTPTWTWISGGGGGNGTFRYKLDDPDLSSGVSITPSATFTPTTALPVGAHTLYVQERDDAGNWSSSGSFVVNIDTSSPNPPNVNGTTPTSDTTPTWTWTTGGSGNGTFRFKLDDSDLSSGATVTTNTLFTPGAALPGGIHTFYIQERDDAGNWSSSGSFTIDIDIIGPNPPNVSGITPTTDTTPTWTWISGGGGGNGTFRYKLDDPDLSTGATITPSATFTPTTALPVGVHTLYVQERDSIGNWSSSESFTIDIDITGPNPPNVSGTTPTTDTTPTWTWISGGGGGNGTFRYKLDDPDLSTGATVTTNTSFTPGTAVSVGAHILYVQERDDAGNWSSSGSFTIDIDISGPNPPNVSGTTPTIDTTPMWTWISGGGSGNGTFRYKLDDSDLSTGAAVTTNTSFTPGTALSVGVHILYVQERDAAGNWSVSGSFTIDIDISAPNPPNVSGTTPTSDTTPTWTWTSGGGGGNGTFRYKLDDSDLSTGATETTNTSFTPGTALSGPAHILYVQERDAAGNWSVNGSFTITITSAGSLDASFDSDGKATTDIGIIDQVNALAIQTDGKIVVAGYAPNASGNYDFAVARYNADGNLDTSFDSDGLVTTDLNGGDDQANALAIQTDGKIVVAGFTNNSNFVIARYNTDGSLDTGFDSDGLVTTDFGPVLNEAHALAIQTDGKIVVAGVTGSSDLDFAIARYNSDGSLDTGFDSDGLVKTDFGSTDEQANALAIQTDGKIVVAGYTLLNDYDFAIARYNTNGSLDTSFNSDGMETSDFSFFDQAFALAIQTDGKIVVVGSSLNASFNADFAVARYNTIGLLDTSFDLDGLVMTDFGISHDNAYAVAIQTDGKIVVAGSTPNGSTTDFALTRYDSDGSLDTSFDTDGKVTTDFGLGNDVAYALAIQNDGKLLVAGYADSGSNNDFALARYIP